MLNLYFNFAVFRIVHCIIGAVLACKSYYFWHVKIGFSLSFFFYLIPKKTLHFAHILIVHHLDFICFHCFFLHCVLCCFLCMRSALFHSNQNFLPLTLFICISRCLTSLAFSVYISLLDIVSLNEYTLCGNKKWLWFVI